MPELTTHGRSNRTRYSRQVPNTDVPKRRIEMFCRRWGIWRLGVYGSVLRDDFGPESEMEFLADFDPARKYTMCDILGMKEELKKIFGHESRIVSRDVIERSENYLRRELVFETTETIFEAYRNE